jgi:hypothetical protein
MPSVEDPIVTVNCRTTITELITGGELGCSGGVSGSCFKRDTRCVTLETNEESFGLSIYMYIRKK